MIFMDEDLTPLHVTKQHALLQQRDEARKEGKWVVVCDGRLPVGPHRQPYTSPTELPDQDTK